MWATLAIASALTLVPNQAGSLKLSNPHLTYGILGQVRENNKFLPGDALFLRFDIDGISVDKEGRIKYSLGLKLTDGNGKQVFAQVPQLIEASNTLGGNTLPAFAFADILNNTAPGKYTMTVTVKDQPSGQSKDLTYDFEVLKKDFGIGRIGIFYDDQGKLSAPTTFLPGQSAWVHFYTLGFDRDSRDKNPHIQVKMRVLDSTGKATVPTPLIGETKQVPQGFQNIPWYLKLDLNRPGKFKIELEATDVIAKKTVKEVLSITVLEEK
jgi:hypothetical protein